MASATPNQSNSCFVCHEPFPDDNSGYLHINFHHVDEFAELLVDQRLEEVIPNANPEIFRVLYEPEFLERSRQLWRNRKIVDHPEGNYVGEHSVNGGEHGLSVDVSCSKDSNSDRSTPCTSENLTPRKTPQLQNSKTFNDHLKSDSAGSAHGADDQQHVNGGGGVIEIDPNANQATNHYEIGNDAAAITKQERQYPPRMAPIDQYVEHQQQEEIAHNNAEPLLSPMESGERPDTGHGSSPFNSSEVMAYSNYSSRSRSRSRSRSMRTRSRSGARTRSPRSRTRSRSRSNSRSRRSPSRPPMMNRRRGGSSSSTSRYPRGGASRFPRGGGRHHVSHQLTLQRQLHPFPYRKVKFVDQTFDYSNIDVQCLLCPRKFVNYNVAFEHDLEEHPFAIRRYPCGFGSCKVGFSSPEELRSHAVDVHGSSSSSSASSNSFRCQFCSKRFTDSEEFTQHVVRDYRRHRRIHYEQIAFGSVMVRCSKCNDEMMAKEFFGHCRRRRECGMVLDPDSIDWVMAEVGFCSHRRGSCRFFPTCKLNRCTYSHPICAHHPNCYGYEKGRCLFDHLVDVRRCFQCNK